jgi:hypothetical protein
MNVISILDQTSPRRAEQQHGFDLRPLLPQLSETDGDQSWDEFWRRSSQPARPKTK